MPGVDITRQSPLNREVRTCDHVWLRPHRAYGAAWSYIDKGRPGLMAVLAAIDLRADHVFSKVSLWFGFCLSARGMLPLSRSRLTSSWAHFLA